MTATEVMAVPGKMIAAAIVMAIAARAAGEAVTIRSMALRTATAVVVTIVMAIAAMLLPRLAVMIARAISPGDGGNQ